MNKSCSQTMVLLVFFEYNTEILLQYAVNGLLTLFDQAIL